MDVIRRLSRARISPFSMNRRAASNVGAIVEIHELIQRLADKGKAVVVISSYLPEIVARSDRFLVARQGKVVEEFSTLEATEEKIMYVAVH
jgi:simple sugar transport system ATP-binding protein